MRNPITIAGAVLLFAWIAMALPASASQRSAHSAAQGASIDSLAEQECRDERRFDRVDFQRDYGTGKAAFTRCVKDELR